MSLETGIIVPAGAIIVVPPQLVHLDNSIWGKDACQFNPNRFLSKALLCHGHSRVGGKPDPVSVTSLEGSHIFQLNCISFMPYGTCMLHSFVLFASGFHLPDYRLVIVSDWTSFHLF